MAKGSCVCNIIKYEYFDDPIQKVLCHCLTCRKVTGSTNSVCLIMPSSNFTFSTGVPERIITKHETGLELELFFCGKCGSVICKEPKGGPTKGFKIVFAGTLDDASSTQALALENMKPQAELWVKYRVGWLKPIEGATQMQGFT